MKIIFQLKRINVLKNRLLYLTWGVFDGVHLGHQKILQSLVDQARAVSGQSMILTFQRHPDKVLGKACPLNITSLEHRLILFKQLGIDNVVCYPFNKFISRLSPEDFIRRIVVDKLKAYGLVMSCDTRFGHHRRGDIRQLKALCRKYNLVLTVIPLLKYQGRVISSTRIRENILRGNLQEAGVMLGRPVSLFGKVVRGRGVGRRLGFPTANLKARYELIPPSGVYASRVNLHKRVFNALTNIGLRPTLVTGQKRLTIETYLIGYKNRARYNLYGRELEISLLAKIRDECKFKSSDELTRQIRKDQNFLRQRLINI